MIDAVVIAISAIANKTPKNFSGTLTGFEPMASALALQCYNTKVKQQWFPQHQDIPRFTRNFEQNHSSKTAKNPLAVAGFRSKTPLLKAALSQGLLLYYVN